MLVQKQDRLLQTTTFDCSNMFLDQQMIHRLIKHAKLFPRLKVLKLAKCGLDDDRAAELLLLMHLKLDHLDISDNDLGEAAGVALVEGMQVRICRVSCGNHFLTFARACVCHCLDYVASARYTSSV